MQGPITLTYEYCCPDKLLAFPIVSRKILRAQSPLRRNLSLPTLPGLATDARLLFKDLDFAVELHRDKLLADSRHEHRHGHCQEHRLGGLER